MSANFFEGENMSENDLASVPNVRNDTTKVQKCQKILWNNDELAS